MNDYDDTIAAVSRAIEAIGEAMDACRDSGTSRDLRRALFEAANTVVKVKGELGQLARANNKRFVA